MADIELVIKIDEDIYKAKQHLVNNQKRMVDKVDIAIANGTPHETVTEFADRCHECWARYGKMLNQDPKTGDWEQYGNSWEDKFKCSECGKEQPKILCGERIIGHWSDYCPNCGCHMVEPQESEE